MFQAKENVKRLLLLGLVVVGTAQGNAPKFFLSLAAVSCLGAAGFKVKEAHQWGETADSHLAQKWGALASTFGYAACACAAIGVVCSKLLDTKKEEEKPTQQPAASTLGQLIKTAAGTVMTKL